MKSAYFGSEKQQWVSSGYRDNGKISRAGASTMAVKLYKSCAVQVLGSGSGTSAYGALLTGGGKGAHPGSGRR